ncbi:MAG: hypothetical protein WBC33_03095, partial [Conexibacter sp.]
MDPTAAVRVLLDAAPDALVVSSLGTATSALRAVSDDGPHLYMGGSMGTALAVAEDREHAPRGPALGDTDRRRERGAHRAAHVEVRAVVADGAQRRGRS